MGSRAAFCLLFSLLAAPAAAQTLLVLPFEPQASDPRYDWLGEGLAQLTAERLSGPGRATLSREDWVAALERLGLPAGIQPSRATMLRVAEELEADFVLFGRYRSDGATLHITAQALRRDPAGLSPAFEASGPLASLMDTHAPLAAALLGFVLEAEPPLAASLPRLRLDAFENYIRGILAADPGQKLRLLREATRAEPAWMLPVAALGRAYFAAQDCENALIWLSRVPPAHDRGYEAGFLSGVCHLLRNDLARAESAFLALREMAPDELPPALLNNLGVVRAREGRWAEAAALWSEASEAELDEPDFWFNRALGLVLTGDPAAAVGPLNDVLARRPADRAARALLVFALERSGRAAEAASEREAAGEPLPKLAEAELAPLARVQSRLGAAPLRRVREPEAALAGAREEPRR
jgi:Flp pilus assembly protein TadD/TolB-like protein